MPDPKRYNEFAELIRLHTSHVLAYINSLVLNWSDADDLFQETCVVLWQKFDDFQSGTNFLAWALRIADHKVMKFQTQRSRHTVFLSRLRESLQEDFLERSPDDAANALASLSNCMDKLSPQDRSLVKSCYMDHVAVRQLAATLGRPLKSVQNSLYRIRGCLLDCVRRELNQKDISHLSIQPVPSGKEDGV